MGRKLTLSDKGGCWAPGLCWEPCPSPTVPPGSCYTQQPRVLPSLLNDHASSPVPTAHIACLAIPAPTGCPGSLTWLTALQPLSFLLPGFESYIHELQTSSLWTCYLQVSSHFHTDQSRPRILLQLRIDSQFRNHIHWLLNAYVPGPRCYTGVGPLRGLVTGTLSTGISIH